MALAETTLSVACGLNDKSLTVASATSIAVDRILRINGEQMKVSKDYVSASTTVPVLRGQDGTPQKAHVINSRVVHGAGTDWGNNGVAAASAYPVIRGTEVTAYSAAATMTLPSPGTDLRVLLLGSAFTLTVPVPTKELDGVRIDFVGQTAAAYVLEFTGGLGGASTNYETVTFAAGGRMACSVIASDETWVMFVQTPMAGTVTNITTTLS